MGYRKYYFSKVFLPLDIAVWFCSVDNPGEMIARDVNLPGGHDCYFLLQWQKYPPHRTGQNQPQHRHVSARRKVDRDFRGTHYML